MYVKDPLELGLSLDYWCPADALSQHDSFHHRPPQRQVPVSVQYFLYFKFAHDMP